MVSTFLGDVLSQLETFVSPCPNHSFVFIVGANSDPDEIFAVLDRKSPVIKTDPDRPKLPNFFEMEGRMRRISFKQLKVLCRYLLNRFWKSLIAFPEAIRCPMHLESPETSFPFFIKGFPSQKIQLS